MSRLNIFLLLGGFLACATLGVQAARNTRSAQNSHAAGVLLEAVLADTAELERLRAADETRLFGEPPAEDFIERVNRVITSLGLPPGVATAIAREADRAVSASPGAEAHRRRDMRIELRPLSPPDLGRFLAVWNTDNPAWSVRRISLRKINDRRSTPARFHAILTCSAEYTPNRSLP